MLTIAFVPSLAGAYALKTLIEAVGIEVFIPDEEIIGDVLDLLPPVEFRIQVAREDIERVVTIAHRFPGARVHHPSPSQPPVLGSTLSKNLPMTPSSCAA